MTDVQANHTAEPGTVRRMTQRDGAPEVREPSSPDKGSPREGRDTESMDILLVDDEAELRLSLAEALRDAGHRVTMASDGAEARGHVLARVFDVVICDVRLPQVDGLTLFRRLRHESPTTDVILITAFGEVSDAVAALKEGAYDYLTKPFDIDELMVTVKRMASQRALRKELEQARVELSGRKPENLLIGQSPGMRRVLSLIEMVAQSEAPTLVTGESGTGKELVARMLHDRSARREAPFVVVNCGALTETLIEAELFGHERGAFTGAVRRRDGRFKAADGGTLFLDEVAELPLPAQAKLLRVLQEGTFEPLGTNTTVKVDVRVVSATHRNLKTRISEGLFREDLFYRINVIEIALPPLRERPGDLSALLQHFLQRFTPKARPLPAVSPAAWAALARHPYPGNVRELSHAIEHAVVLSGGGEIALHHLPSGIAAQSAAGRTLPEAGGSGGPPEVRPLQTALKEFEREYLLRAITQANGKRIRAAEMLGISRKSLWEKLRQYGLGDADIEDRDGA
jgi:two-component system, NtrC family, response regulator AtoC